MTQGVLQGVYLGDLLQVGDYTVSSPNGAWSGAGALVNVRAEIRDGDLWQFGGDVGNPPTFSFARIHKNGVWGDWAGIGSVTAPVVQTTAPTITSISPTSITDNGQSQDITVTGTGFVRGATVYVNNDAATVGATTFVSATSLTRAVNTGHATIVAPTVVSFQVVNPDGKRSNAALLTVAT